MELSSGPSILFGGGLTPFPALAKIDDTHYLSAAFHSLPNCEHGSLTLSIPPHISNILKAIEFTSKSLIRRGM